MQPLTMSHPVGTVVLYTGVPDVVLVSDDAVRAGRVLGEHHPGTVTAADPERGLRVSFRGLETEPISRAWFVPDDKGVIPGLVAVRSDEWSAACTTGWWSNLAS